MKKLCATLFTAIAMVGLGFQGTAAAAHPSGCSYGKWDLDGAWAECSKSNGGKYKATVICRALDGGGDIHREAGVWKSSGVSLVFCPTMTTYKTAGLLTKPS
ncbi:hypothetical protein [Streptomyces sp. MAR25Y5]|uniref:hypothetical protein n=1 Tax=Streptomyces sp. MAR25Y5 TaxID=2962028 RepID=UPI0020B7AE0C|nr:hypothetical protein [Streptomyces sp. MAR25Y5]MCP3766413.1 hypothetical protein [Streptomyces sp. MAR25Y5]